MASAIEVFWQWSYIMALLIVVLLLICCFGGCWGSFQTNVRGFCADGINCGFSPFRKKKVKTIKVTPVPNAPDGTVVMSRMDEEVGDSDSDDEDYNEPLRSCCTGIVSVITCWYCFGMLKPASHTSESRAMLPKTLVVAQPITGKPASKPSKVPVAKPSNPVAKPSKPSKAVRATSPARVIKAPPVIVSPGGQIEVMELGTSSHLPLLHFYST